MTLEIKDLNVGDIFYECEYGECVEYEVLTQPRLLTEDELESYGVGWYCTARNCNAPDDSEPTVFYSALGYEYFLKIYSYPAYR